MSDPNDPNDPNSSRGKKEDGWKTVVFQSPFAQGAQNPQAPPASPGQPQGGYPPQQPPQPRYPSQAPPASQSYGQPQSPFRPPAPPSPPAGGADKTQIYTPAQFASASQNAPQSSGGSPQSASGPPQNFPPPPSGGGPYAPPPAFGGTGNPPPPPSGYQPPRVAPPPGQPFPQQYGAPPKKKTKTWIWVLGIIATLIVVCIVGCVGVLYVLGKSALAKPDTSITVLHTLMASGNDAAIYKSADEGWKAVVPRATSDALFDQIHEKLGKPISYTPAEPIGEPDTQGLLEVKLNTTFENGMATETIVFHKVDGRLKLYHYSIDSNGGTTDHERPVN